ncbi:hypothetical protein ACS3UN_13290 [Oscillospiraceae bacterium LTW-04]|nr:hypothetical protein RBH76_01100 [Oscillospiraceae bacterium MB24-C1]
MDLRRERKRGNRVIGVLLILIFLCMGAIAVIFLSRFAPVEAFKSDMITADFSAVTDIDARAVKVSHGLFSKTEEKNPPDQFSYEIKEKLVFSAASEEAALLLKNPPQNQYLMVLELVLEDSGEVVLRTGSILPGQMIKRAALDEKLSAGDYKAIANLCAVDAQNGTLAGVLEQPVTIVVKS